MQVLEACAPGIANYSLAVMHDVEAFALTLRVPQGDTLHFPGENLRSFKNFVSLLVGKLRQFVVSTNQQSSFSRHTLPPYQP
jgi:hypothetical protein